MKIIDFETIKNICSEINPSTYLTWIEDAILNKDEFDMPNKSRISQNNGDYFAIMPCMCEKTNYAMVKMIGRHNLKLGEKRSTMMSDLLLYEADTGVLKALMDGEYITTIRTGAAAAQAALMYSKKDFKTIGLIGLGNIMTACVSVLLNELHSKNVILKIYKHHEQEIRFINYFKSYKNVEFKLCDTYEETMYDSDIIISAVTKATNNFCDDTYYKKGCTIIPIMTMGFQNCDVTFDKVYTDEINQIKDFKYFNQFKSINNTTDVLNGIAKGRENNDERIIVYYYGLAIHDLYFASKIYELAKSTDEFNYKYCKEKFFMK